MKHSLRYRCGQASIALILLIILAISILTTVTYITLELTSLYEAEKQRISQLEIERFEENIIVEKIGQGVGSIHLNITNVGSVPVLIKYAIIVYVENGVLKMAYDELNVYINVGEELYNVKLDIPPPKKLKYIILVTSRGRAFIEVVETVKEQRGTK